MATDNSPASGAASTHVRPADLRRLLDAGPGSCLLLEEGKVQVRNDPGDDEGLVVVTRADLAAHLGDRPDDTELTTEAALLDDKIRLLGA